MRVVLDTNVLLSACMKPEGLEAKTARMSAAGVLQLCVSQAVEAEYRDVLFRPKFAAVHAVAEILLNELGARWLVVAPTETLSAASDEDDNRFLECAQAASAAFLVTGNLRHYPAQWMNTRVVNAREFLLLLKAEQFKDGPAVAVVHDALDPL